MITDLTSVEQDEAVSSFVPKRAVQTPHAEFNFFPHVTQKSDKANEFGFASDISAQDYYKFDTLLSVTNPSCIKSHSQDANGNTTVVRGPTGSPTS